MTYLLPHRLKGRSSGRSTTATRWATPRSADAAIGRGGDGGQGSEPVDGLLYTGQVPFAAWVYQCA